MDSFLRKHATEKRTLDIGSLWSPCAPYFPNRISTDIEDKKGVDVVTDAHELLFRDGEFEVILCTGVLEHLHTPEKAISEMKIVLEDDVVLY